MEKFRIFREGNKVNIAQCYLTDEVGINAHATPTATILSEPKDNEELVCVLYENGLIDHVPQYILENIESKELFENQIDLMCEIQGELNINIVNCGNCGGVFLHKLNETEIKCPYCCFNSEPCDFPDFIS